MGPEQMVYSSPHLRLGVLRNPARDLPQRNTVKIGATQLVQEIGAEQPGRRLPARNRMLSSFAGGGSLQTSYCQPRDSTVLRVQSKVKATSGLETRCNGLTSTATGPCPVISK